MNISINLHKLVICSPIIYSAQLISLIFSSCYSLMSFFYSLFSISLPSNHYQCISWVRRESFHSKSLKKSKSQPKPNHQVLAPHLVELLWMMKVPETMLSACIPSQNKEGLRNMELELASSSSGASLMAQVVKNLSAMWETWVWSLGQEDLLEKEMATHSSMLSWRIPWTGAGYNGLSKSLNAYVKIFAQKMFIALFVPFTPATWHQVLVYTEWQNR